MKFIVNRGEVHLVARLLSYLQSIPLKNTIVTDDEATVIIKNFFGMHTRVTFKDNGLEVSIRKIIVERALRMVKRLFLISPRFLDNLFSLRLSNEKNIKRFETAHIKHKPLIIIKGPDIEEFQHTPELKVDGALGGFRVFVNETEFECVYNDRAFFVYYKGTRRLFYEHPCGYRVTNMSTHELLQRFSKAFTFSNLNDDIKNEGYR